MASHNALQVSLTKTLNEEWFQALIEDCKDTIIEKRFIISEELIKMKWEVGDRILQDIGKFERSRIYGRQIIVTVSKALSCSEREIYRCVQFRKKYPELKTLPEGKAITWHKIVNTYLPDHPTTTGKDPEDPLCPHRQLEILIRCVRCRERLGFRRVGGEEMVDLGEIIDSEKGNKHLVGDEGKK